MSVCASISPKTLIFMVFSFRTPFVLLEIFVETAVNLTVMSSPRMLYSGAWAPIKSHSSQIPTGLAAAGDDACLAPLYAKNSF